MLFGQMLWATIICAGISVAVNASTAPAGQAAANAAAAAQQSTNTSAATTTVPHIITNADVMAMVRAGMSEQTILLAIQRGPTNLDTSADALMALKQAGASDSLLAAVKNGVPSASSGTPAMIASPIAANALAQPTTAAPGTAALLPSLQQQYPTEVAANQNANPSKSNSAFTTSSTGSSSCSGQVAGDYHQQVELLVLMLVSEERQSQGSGKLNTSDSLTTAARNHSCSMAQENYFDHTDPKLGNPLQRLQSQGIKVKSMAENLAEDNGPDPAHSAVQSWLADPDHRENLLNPSYGCTGIGVAVKPDGTYLTTEIFTPAPCPGSTK